MPQNEDEVHFSRHVVTLHNFRQGFHRALEVGHDIGLFALKSNFDDHGELPAYGFRGHRGDFAFNNALATELVKPPLAGRR